MLVKRAMSKNVVSVSVPGNREKVLDLMRKEDKAVLPVVKGDTKQLVGLITRSDLIVNPDEEQIAILMSTDLVTASPDDDVADVAKKMDEQINKLTSLVNDLLDVTKIQNGKILLNKSDFDFDDLVEEIVTEQQMITSHKILVESEKIGNI